MPELKIVVDKSQPLAIEAFSQLGEVQALAVEEMNSQALKDTDLLICRSTIKVDKDLIAGTKVKFVATCTIGYDHFDLEYFKEHSITFTNAAGCNARSVAEYFLAAILEYAVSHNKELAGLTLGIIGAGNVGKEVIRIAKILDIQILVNDPPRASIEGDEGFCSLEELLQKSDIVSIHTPLIYEGAHPTFKLANDKFFSFMKDDALFLNLARGKVVDETALLNALDSGKVGEAIIDVHYNEPIVNKELITKSFLATPHIAGHSYDGKVNGTLLAFNTACTYLGEEKEFDLRGFYPPTINLDSNPLPDCTLEENLLQVIRQCYDIKVDDNALRSNPNSFSMLRKNYPPRYEFMHYSITPHESLRQILLALGFKINKV